MTQKELAKLIRSISVNRIRLIRPAERIKFKNMDMACYPDEEINEILKCMHAWEQMLLELVEENSVRVPLATPEPVNPEPVDS